MVEVADIFRAAGSAYRQIHATALSQSETKAMLDIADCRTAAFGGHLRACDHCFEKRYTYHSCRNRHCPKCQGQRTQRWLDKQRARLLPVPYFLLTFTLPAELRSLARTHPHEVYSILMRAAAAALIKLAADPKYLGATPGIIAVLHTWTRAMLFHPHVHFLVTAGGLSPDKKRWLSPKNPRFLVPGWALSIIFRAKVRDALKKAGLLGRVPGRVWSTDKKWVVHLKHAGTGHKVLDYLARYLFRIAIANSRIESFENGKVRFRYRDNRTAKIKHCTLTSAAFIARFLLHVLPARFTKVRHYGLYSSAQSKDLERLRPVLSPPAEQPTITPASLDKPHINAFPPMRPSERCPVCRVGRLWVVETLPAMRSRAPP